MRPRSSARPCLRTRLPLPTSVTVRSARRPSPRPTTCSRWCPGRVRHTRPRGRKSRSPARAATAPATEPHRTRTRTDRSFRQSRRRRQTCPPRAGDNRRRNMMVDERQGRLATEAAELAEERSFLGQIRLWGGIAGAALLVLFLVQNLQEAEVNFLWFEWNVRLIFALIGSAVLGAIASMLIGFFRRRSQQAEMRAQLRRERERQRDQ